MSGHEPDRNQSEHPFHPILVNHSVGDRMHAQEFNEQVKAIMAPMLSAVGFKQVGTDFVRENDDIQLVLLRFGGSKFASLSQFTRFMLCFRHVFLRDLDEVVPQSHPKNGHAYPFKVRPSDLEGILISEWRYQFELNPTCYDEIEYGGTKNVEPILRKMGELIATKGIEWANSFTAGRAMHLLEHCGSNAWCERLWINDYKNRIK
jgi:hypothetical protein